MRSISRTRLGFAVFFLPVFFLPGFFPPLVFASFASWFVDEDPHVDWFVPGDSVGAGVALASFAASR